MVTSDGGHNRKLLAGNGPRDHWMFLDFRLILFLAVFPGLVQSSLKLKWVTEATEQLTVSPSGRIVVSACYAMPWAAAVLSGRICCGISVDRDPVWLYFRLARCLFCGQKVIRGGLISR